jgi:hypothetical protein
MGVHPGIGDTEPRTQEVGVSQTRPLGFGAAAYPESHADALGPADALGSPAGLHTQRVTLTLWVLQTLWVSRYTYNVWAYCCPYIPTREARALRRRETQSPQRTSQKRALG